jgi:hypothetical protein
MPSTGISGRDDESQMVASVAVVTAEQADA